MFSNFLPLISIHHKSIRYELMFYAQSIHQFFSFILPLCVTVLLSTNPVSFYTHSLTSPLNDSRNFPIESGTVSSTSVFLSF